MTNTKVQCGCDNQSLLSTLLDGDLSRGSMKQSESVFVGISMDHVDLCSKQWIQNLRLHGDDRAVEAGASWKKLERALEGTFLTTAQN